VEGGLSLLKRILIVHTGGTFGMLEKSGLWEPSSQNDLAAAVPELSQLATVHTVVPFVQDSAELTVDHINQLASVIAGSRDRYDGFIVIHGTDTMAYSASALSFMLLGLGKPVVFTGSQRPFMQIRTDARSNLINSVEIAASSFNEIAVFFGNKLLRGNRATKVSTWKFEAFDSPNFPTLGEAGVNINFNLYQVGNPTLETHEFQPFGKLRETVFVIHLFPGLQNTDLDFLLHNEHIEAFIIVAYGAGNLPTGKDSGLVGFIGSAIEKGKIVAIATQCTHGRVSLDIYESARIVRRLGVLGCMDMTLEASVMKLTYLLSRYDGDRETVCSLFETNIAGEITDEHHGQK